MSLSGRPLSFAIVALCAIAVRLVAATQLGGSALDHLERVAVTDMHFYDAWAQRIAAGDWLTQGGIRPDAPEIPCRALRMRDPQAGCDAASTSAVWDRWLGPHSIWQDALYPYVMAACYRVSGHDERVVRALQGLLGVGTALMCWGIALMLFGEAPALAAGLVAALYGPAVYYEHQLLRETLGAFLAVGTCFLTLRAAASPRRYATALAAGACAGLGGLLRATGYATGVAAVVVAVWLVARAKRIGAGIRPDPQDRRSWPRMAAAMVAGAALALLPWIARNLATGSPLLQAASTGPMTFAIGNSTEAGGSTGYQFGDGVVRILAKSDGSELRAVGAAIDERGGLGPWLRLVADKFLAFWQWRELPNNANYYAFLEQATVLRYVAVPWSLVAPLGLCGLVFAIRRAPGAMLLVVYAVATIAICALFYNLSRFRLPVGLMFAPLAGYAPFALWEAVHRRDRLAMAGVAALGVGVALVFLGPQARGPLIRTADRLMTTGIAVALADERLAAGLPDKALAPLEAELAVEPHGIRAIASFQKPGGPVADAAALARAYLALHETAAKALAANGRAAAAEEQTRLAEGLRFFLGGAAPPAH